MMKFLLILVVVAFASGNPLVDSRFDADTDVILRLFTRNNPTEEQILTTGDYSAILLSNFDFNKPLKIYTHGWSTNWANANLVAAWLAHADVNVLVVDWTAATNTSDEALMVSRVPSVGQHVADFIDWVSSYGIKFEEIHLVGMSVGSHVAGHIGRYCKNGVVEYITGCDPPKAFWQDMGGNINARDGKYVEAIHTSTLVHSFLEPIATADFYPNGGETQPGCDGNDGCDHARSIQFFIESIGSEDFGAMKCNSFDEMDNNECADLERSYMGGTGSAKNISGVFYLNTNAVSPYAQGRYFNPNTDINLRLFTRENPTESQIIINGDYSNILLSNFDFNKRLKIFAHGWAPIWEEAHLVEAWLAHGDVNVVIVDWTAATSTSDEALMVSRVPSVGQYGADFIDWVSTYGIKFEELHLVGMSVGSHTVGHIGRYCKNGTVEYITGCDPPKAFWQDMGGNINAGDGKYVEAIHTSTLVHSFLEPITTADFYPNGGETQPGCNGNAGCDHQRALDFVVESIGNENFGAIKCNSFAEMENNECADIHRSYLGGTDVAKDIMGVYYLTTNSESPYAQGSLTSRKH